MGSDGSRPAAVLHDRAGTPELPASAAGEYAEGEGISCILHRLQQTARSSRRHCRWVHQHDNMVLVTVEPARAKHFLCSLNRLQIGT